MSKETSATIIKFGFGFFAFSNDHDEGSVESD